MQTTRDRTLTQELPFHSLNHEFDDLNNFLKEIIEKVRKNLKSFFKVEKCLTLPFTQTM